MGGTPRSSRAPSSLCLGRAGREGRKLIVTRFLPEAEVPGGLLAEHETLGGGASLGRRLFHPEYHESEEMRSLEKTETGGSERSLEG